MINFSGTQINTVRGDVIIQGLTPSLSGIDPPIHLNLNPKLEAHLQEQFNYYERENIAVKTPQLLLMLLRYENCNILKVFNSLQIGTNRRYGDFLLTYFQAWNQHFQKNGISYEEKNFEDFLKERIFEPLGMSQSFVYSMRNDESVSLYVPTPVQGHDLFKKDPMKTQNDYLNGVMGDKIMYSTVEDIWKYNQALDAHLLLPDSLQREAFQPGSPDWKNGENYGFGWRQSLLYPDVYFHFGWWKGYRSAIIRDERHRRFLVILGNTTYIIPPDVTFAFMTDTSVMLPESEPLN